MARTGELTAGGLSRLGFVEASVGLQTWLRLRAAHPSLPDALLETVGCSADPDAALAGFSRILEASPDAGRLAETVSEEPPLAERLFAVLGASTALTDHLVRRPADVMLLADPLLDAVRPTARALRTALLEAVGADPSASAPRATLAAQESYDALRVAYRRALLTVAGRDLTASPDVMDTAGELADLAAAALEAALAIARSEVGPAADHVRFAIIGMGKCGGRELNYISDVDVIYVVEPTGDMGDSGDGDATAIGDRLAASIARACSSVTSEGSLWEVDAGLRPEGKAGALTRTLASHVTYYKRWAKTWEFQALLKARPVAGDLDLGAEYVAAVSSMVWEAAGREGFVVDVQQMRRRVEAHVPAAEADRELKLGPGGLRDIEFAVQLLQLVHGRVDPTLRRGNTVEALAALAAGGYVGRDDAAAMAEAYGFLRLLEHRLQLRRLRRTHLMPADPAQLRVLARSIGLTRDPAQQLTAQWRSHAIEARRLHEKLFYRPLLQAVARLDAGEARLTSDAAQSRIEALGYVDPKGALRHIEALTSGVSRRAAIQRTLLPVMLGWFADAPDPDAGLLGFRRVSEELGSTHWYLALLRDAGATAERLACVLASSRFATDLLLAAPDAVTLLADDDGLRPRTLDELVGEMTATASRASTPEAAAAAVRAIRRRELFRLSCAEVLDALSPEQTGPAVSDVAAAALRVMLDVVLTAIAAGDPPPTRFAVVAMGRFGGRELGLGSDLDVLFVHDPLGGSDDEASARFATSVASELRRLLTAQTSEPPMQLDADLRPEGRSGPLVRTLASYRAYYDRWSLTWESQALLRASAVAGDPALGEEFAALVDPLRWPAGGLTAEQIVDIRRIKARVESERLPRGANPALHTKLGPGGLADVEWAVQLLQMQHGHVHPELQTTSTLEALAAAREADIVSASDATTLRAAWLLATAVRDAIMVAKGRPSDSLPGDAADLRLVAGVMGYGPGHAADLVEDYRRVSRRARAVVEEVIYG